MFNYTDKNGALMAKQYIGDSVYVDWDMDSIVLTTENGLPDDPSNRIVLEPEVWKSLLRYVNSPKEREDKHLCGKCGKEVIPVEIEPVYISEWDKENNVPRRIAYNCCGRVWLWDYEGKAIDYGEAIPQKQKGDTV